MDVDLLIRSLHKNQFAFFLPGEASHGVTFDSQHNK